MNDEELTRLAEQEILRETKQAAERAAVYGALGWMKSPLKPTNKQFLLNTILPTLSTNRKHHYSDRRDYRKTNLELCASCVCPSMNFSGQVSSHRSKKESGTDSKGSSSHRDEKNLHRSNRDRHDKDSSPSRKSKISESSSLDNNSKEHHSNSTEVKSAESKSKRDSSKESEYTRHRSSKDRYISSTRHKSHKDDKYDHRRSDNSHHHHHKNHEFYINADQRYKGNEHTDSKTEVGDVQIKSKIVSKSQVKIEDGYCVGDSRGWDDNNRVPESNSKFKYSECVIRCDKVKNEVPDYTGHDREKSFTVGRSQHSKHNGSFQDKDNSNMERDNDKKSVFNSESSHQRKSEEKTIKIKTSRKRKKEKSKTHKDTGKRVKRSKEHVSSKHNVASTKEKKHSSKNTAEIQTKLSKNGRYNQENVEIFGQKQQIDDSNQRFQENEEKHALTKQSRNKKIEVDSITSTSAKKKKDKFVAKPDDQPTKSMKNKLNTSDLKERSYSSTKDKNQDDRKHRHEKARAIKNSNHSQKNDPQKHYTSENHDNNEPYRTSSKPSKMHSEKHHTHNSGKSNCLRDITDEMHYRDTENSRQNKRRKCIESD